MMSTAPHIGGSHVSGADGNPSSKSLAVQNSTPPGERAADERRGPDAIAALEAGLRALTEGRQFQWRARVKSLQCARLPRGVSVKVVFDRRATAPEIPDRVTLVVSRARAWELWQGLLQVLDPGEVIAVGKTKKGGGKRKY
jgi:hypothetical protein